jgi:hypothetical protein
MRKQLPPRKLVIGSANANAQPALPPPARAALPAPPPESARVAVPALD